MAIIQTYVSGVILEDFLTNGFLITITVNATNLSPRTKKLDLTNVYNYQPKILQTSVNNTLSNISKNQTLGYFLVRDYQILC